MPILHTNDLNGASMPRTRCLVCAELIPSGVRCSTCRRQQRAKYGGAWPATAAAVIAAHVEAHGYTCPGWRRPAHPAAPGTLTADHVEPDSLEGGVAVLCRACNSSKRDGRLGVRRGFW